MPYFSLIKIILKFSYPHNKSPRHEFLDLLVVTKNIMVVASWEILKEENYMRLLISNNKVFSKPGRRNFY